MANVKISELTDYAVPAGTDIIPIVDLANDQTKKVTINNLMAVSSNAVTSVNTQTGAVVLDADDISDAGTTNKFATQAQLDAADSAIQTTDSIDALSDVDTSSVTPTDGQALVWDNTAQKWEPGTVSGGGVTSVNTQTGAVVLDADDIDDTSTAHKFATAAQLSAADSAVQPDSAPTFTATVQTTERTITASAFDLSTGNNWTVGAITVPAPTNATAGTSGLIRITAGPVVWNAVFKFPGGSAPSISSFPAIIPFYVQTSSVILMGNVAEGIN